MEEEAHVGDNDVIDVSQKFVRRVISELPGSEGVEAADPPQESTFLGQFFVNEASHGSEHYQPGLLNQVHCCDKYIQSNSTRFPNNAFPNLLPSSRNTSLGSIPD